VNIARQQSSGYAPSVWVSQPTGWIAIAFGVVIIIGGIAAKMFEAMKIDIQSVSGKGDLQK